MDGGFFPPSISWLHHNEQGTEDAASFMDRCDDFSFLDELAIQSMVNESCNLDNNHRYKESHNHKPHYDEQHNSMYPQSMQPFHHASTTAAWKQLPSTTLLPPPPSDDRRVPPGTVPEAGVPRILSFEASREVVEAEGLQGGCRGADEGGALISQWPCTAPLQARNRGDGGRQLTVQQEHIMAERKRREKLSQQFIKLSAIVPGLKRMDKASVLGDAIKYMKELKERVQHLEEQAARQTTGSMVVVKKSKVPDDADESCYSDGNNSDGRGTSVTTTAMSDGSLPVIEARVANRTVLLRIQCERRKGILVRVLAEVERVGLSIVNSSAMPFAAIVLDMTVVAQMEDGFSMSAKDLVSSLHNAIIQIA